MYVYWNKTLRRNNHLTEYEDNSKYLFHSFLFTYELLNQPLSVTNKFAKIFNKQSINQTAGYLVTPSVGTPRIQEQRDDMTATPVDLSLSSTILQ